MGRAFELWLGRKGVPTTSSRPHHETTPPPLSATRLPTQHTHLWDPHPQNANDRALARVPSAPYLTVPTEILVTSPSYTSCTNWHSIALGCASISHPHWN